MLNKSGGVTMIGPQGLSPFPYMIVAPAFEVKRMFRTKVVVHRLMRTAPDKVKVERVINNKKESVTFRTDLNDIVLGSMFLQMVNYVHNALANGMKPQQVSMPNSFYSNLMGSFAPRMEDPYVLMPEL
jgi:hypothetical protein